jgi:hypothetical protein
MLRRVSVLAVVTAAVAALLYTATAAPAPPSPNAPRSFSRPLVQPAGIADDAVRISPQDGAWGERVPGELHYRFSWLECDLEGKSCVPLSGLQTQSIVPPQELRIVTLRGVVTATNRFGSTTVKTGNFFYDMAGYPFEHRAFVRRHLQFDPDQLRAWYGLRPDETGAGQTIVITDFGRQQHLRSAVDHFSAHYGLPKTCRTPQARGCFHLVITSAGNPGRVNRSGEGDADVEWAHAIAPDARITFIQFDHAQQLFDKLGWLGDAGQDSVVSDSWCDPCSGFRGFARDVVYPGIALACGRAHVVCVQASGDHGSPGDKPSNSPYVLAVGGTRFENLVDGSARKEVPWGPSGSGDTDVPLRRPAWQKRISAGCTGGNFSLVGVSSCVKRAVPDVSATAASVPDFQPTKDGATWFIFSGTSLSTPLWAGLIALTNQQLAQAGQRPVGIRELHQVLYRGDVAKSLDDIPPHGWDLATGLGSPKSGIVTALAEAIERYRAGG